MISNFIRICLVTYGVQISGASAATELEIRVPSFPFFSTAFRWNHPKNLEKSLFGKYYREGRLKFRKFEADPSVAQKTFSAGINDNTPIRLGWETYTLSFASEQKLHEFVVKEVPQDPGSDAPFLGSIENWALWEACIEFALANEDVDIYRYLFTKKFTNSAFEGKISLFRKMLTKPELFFQAYRTLDDEQQDDVASESTEPGGNAKDLISEKTLEKLTGPARKAAQDFNRRIRGYISDEKAYQEQNQKK